MGYAYLDQGNILHISENKNTAAKYAKNNRVIATEVPAQNGYPVVNGDRVFVYSPDEIYAGGNINTGKELSPEAVPGLVELYIALA